MMSFGTPTGRARMAGATSDAPPEPPAEMMPATLPWRRSQLAKASAIAVTDAPRSDPNTLDPPRPRWARWAAAATRASAAWDWKYRSGLAPCSARAAARDAPRPRRLRRRFRYPLRARRGRQRLQHQADVVAVPGRPPGARSR